MDTDKGNYDILGYAGIATLAFALLFGLGNLAHYCKRKEFPPRPQMEVSQNYKAVLFEVPSRYQVSIYKKDDKTEDSLKLFGIDENKDTIIDNIELRILNPDLELRKLASIEELSKIEKELLKK